MRISGRHAGVPLKTVDSTFAVLLLLVGCSAPGPPGSSGTDAEHGLVVVSSDYQSTNVSLLSFEGEVLSGSLVHSGSTEAGLSVALSGDVILPTASAVGGEVVLLDRLARSVLTWVNVHTARVRAQLPVGTGFKANPHDYILISPNKAYVSRYEPNLTPGAPAAQLGDDLLVVDPAQPAALARLDLSEAMADEDSRYYARPDRGIKIGDRVYVILNGYALDLMDAAPPRIAMFDSERDALLRTLKLPETRDCWSLAVSPTGAELALACIGGSSSVEAETHFESMLLIVSLAPSLALKQRYPASRFGLGSIGLGVAFTSESRVLFTTSGERLSEPRLQDALIELDMATGTHRVLLRSESEPFSLGEIRCVSASAACFVADAERQGGVVHHYEVGSEGALEHRRAIRIENAIGLPPRYLGEF